MEPYDRERFREIRRGIRKMLMDEWDPIGVKEIPEAADEYDSYLGDIFGPLERDATVTEISDHLQWIEVYRMGLGGDPNAVRATRDAVAALLKKLI